jgi:hypothetical protein
MLPLLAEIRTNAPPAEGRSAARRTLRLEVPTTTSHDRTNALIHNLSETGLLIETTAGLAVGDGLEVELPEAGVTAARVIWMRGEFVGCEFATRLPKAAVSAALLRAPVEPPELLVPARAPALWSDIGPAAPDLNQAGDDRPAMIASLVISLLVALALTVALMSFSFA